MQTFEIELDEAQVELLRSYAETIGLTPGECIKMATLWIIRIETMFVTGTVAIREDMETRLGLVTAHLDQIVDAIKAARTVPEGNPFDTPDQRPIS